ADCVREDCWLIVAPPESAGRSFGVDLNVLNRGRSTQVNGSPRQRQPNDRSFIGLTRSRQPRASVRSPTQRQFLWLHAAHIWNEIETHALLLNSGLLVEGKTTCRAIFSISRSGNASCRTRNASSCRTDRRAARRRRRRRRTWPG